MRINDPLVSLARLRGTEKKRVNLDVRMSHRKATSVNIATPFWRRKFRIRNSYPTGRIKYLVNEE